LKITNSVIHCMCLNDFHYKTTYSTIEVLLVTNIQITKLNYKVFYLFDWYGMAVDYKLNTLNFLNSGRVIINGYSSACSPKFSVR